MAEYPDLSAEPPLTGALVPNESSGVPGLVAENRKYPVEAAPLGMAVPLRYALVAEIDEAAFVVTAGTLGDVKLITAP